MILQKNKLLNCVTLLSLLLFAVFIVYDFISDVLRYYWPDTLVFTAIVLFFYFTFDKWNLNVPIFTLIVLGLASHLCGAFGWYANSPLPFIKWDHITHFFGIMPFAMLFFNFFSKWMSKKHKAWSAFLVVIAFLSAMGIGALIEVAEFVGFLSLGYGEGVFYFGAGDSFSDNNAIDSSEHLLDKIMLIGGGWFNACWDLICNGIGAIAGILIMIFARIAFPRKRNVFDNY